MTDALLFVILHLFWVPVNLNCLNNKPMTTEQVEQALFFYCEHVKNIVVNRVQPRYKFLQFEADFISITKSGYASGFEIKISRGDFRKDLKKAHFKAVLENKQKGLERYYYRYKYFYYVVPEKLIPLAEELLPEEFVIVAIVYHEKFDRVSFRNHRVGKKLFNHKWSLEDLLHLAHLGCMILHRSVNHKVQNIKL